MTTAEQVQLFSCWLEGTDIELLELSTGQEVLRLRRGTTGSTALPENEAGFSIISSPSVGLFRRSHPLRTTQLVQPGQHVDEGEPVGLLQVGALLVHVVAPCAGTVLEVVAEDGAAVGFGAPLVRFTRDEVQ